MSRKRPLSATRTNLSSAIDNCYNCKLRIFLITMGW